MLENLALAKLRGYFLKDYRLDALFMGSLLSNSGLENNINQLIREIK